MKNDKETQKVRVRKVFINFQRGAPPETAGVDIEKCVNEAYDFFGHRVVSDRDLLDICFLMITRVIEPLAGEYIDSRKRAWAQHPEMETLLELERKHFGYADRPKQSLETESLNPPSVWASLLLIQWSRCSAPDTYALRARSA